MQVKGSIVQASPVPVHGGHAAEKRGDFCPLPPARQQWEVGTLSPCHFGAGSSSSSHPIPAALQGQVGQKATPTFLQAARQAREPAWTDPTACHGIARVPPQLWGAEKEPPRVSPMHPLTAMPGHGNPLFPPQHEGYQLWARAAENSSFTFIKNTMPLFPLDPSSYLLTVVKYYCSRTSQQAGFPLSLKHPPLFFF